MTRTTPGAPGNFSTGGGGSSTVAISQTGTDNDVDVVSSALPTGASTSGKQDTIIGHLDGVEGLLTTIDTDTGNIDANAGATTDSAATAGGTGTLSAKLRLITSQLNSIDGNTNGIETLLTAIATYVDDLESLLSTSNTNTGAIKTATEIMDDWDESDRAKVNPIAGEAGVEGGAGSVTSKTVRVALASDSSISGIATENTLGTRLSESDFDTKVGSLTEAAPASDTASSGLNGRLQRIAQRITSLIALIPTALTGSGNFKVAVQEALPAGLNIIGYVIPSVSGTTNGYLVSVTDAQTATVTAVKASGGGVFGYHVYNPNTVDIYLHFYDIASGSVTVGSSTRNLTIWVPAGGAIDNVFPFPVTHSTAISMAATTTITGSTAPSTGLLVSVFYR